MKQFIWAGMFQQTARGQKIVYFSENRQTGEPLKISTWDKTWGYCRHVISSVDTNLQQLTSDSYLCSSILNLNDHYVLNCVWYEDQQVPFFCFLCTLDLITVWLSEDVITITDKLTEDKLWDALKHFYWEENEANSWTHMQRGQIIIIVSIYKKDSLKQP